MKPTYEITRIILESYGAITESLGQAKSLLLMKPEARLRRQNRIKTIHSTLAIEGNTLDLDQVSAILENARVVGPEKDIREIQNAAEVYKLLSSFDVYSVSDFLKAHRILMHNLLPSPGEYRRKQVGIMKGSTMKHISPGHTMVPGLMDDLFFYLKKDENPSIIKSCVFHYESEFIHPFEDGNGRMGRLWQTRILMEINPLFEFVPIEAAIKHHQSEYYFILERCDNKGNSTEFIEFMLALIDSSLKETISTSSAPFRDYELRTEYALSMLDDWFDRKAYMLIQRGISSATAGRDLQKMVRDGKVVTKGTGRMTRYKRK